jgi:predicted amidohydrolase
MNNKDNFDIDENSNFSSYKEREENNIILNGDFSCGKAGSTPTGWEIICPNKAIAPKFKLVIRKDGSRFLRASGNGRRECFGFIRTKVHLEPNRTYHMRVKLHYERMKDLNRHLLHGVFSDDFNDGIFQYRKEGSLIIGENRFAFNGTKKNTEVRLYFRFSPNGKVWWHSIELQECKPLPKRLVKIACSWGTGDLSYWAKWLDRAGENNVDVALLPEMYNGKNVKEAELIEGSSGRLLAEKAKQWNMYVCGTFYEKRRDLVLNSAPFFDRNGELIGIYSKNQLYDPELDAGATPGIGYPVFSTDFGKVGIIICYDSWFPETIRILAYKGAELILFPNAGYFTGLMPARAADNGVWIAVSSCGHPAGVWDSGGALAGEDKPNPTRCVESSIQSFEKNEEYRMIITTVDLSIRYSPHWWGGPMLSAPGGRRVRQTLIEPIEDEISRESKRWWKK